MPRYQCRKKAWALQIALVRHVGTDTTTDENQIVELEFVEPRFAPRRFNLLGRLAPAVGWYLVQQQTGQIDFTPPEAFETDYEPI